MWSVAERTGNTQRLDFLLVLEELVMATTEGRSLREAFAHLCNEELNGRLPSIVAKEQGLDFKSMLLSRNSYTGFQKQLKQCLARLRSRLAIL
jgi:hypothetical protein